MMLDGKVAAVTGGASGLGLEIARRFAAEGARVVILDRDRTAGTEAATALHARFLEVDVREAEGVAAAFARIDEEHGGVDVLVSNAGVREIQHPLELGVAEWERVVAINLSGTFHCCQAAARSMVARGGGSIVTMSSMAGLVGFSHRVAYCASKAGIIGLTRSLARDLGASRVRVNAVCPGLVRTPLTEDYFADEGFLRSVGITIPMATWATPGDVADVVLFYASDMSRYVTGTALPVDGGLTAVGNVDVSGEASAYVTAGGSR